MFLGFMLWFRIFGFRVLGFKASSGVLKVSFGRFFVFWVFLGFGFHVFLGVCVVGVFFFGVVFFRVDVFGVFS